MVNTKSAIPDVHSIAGEELKRSSEMMDQRLHHQVKSGPNFAFPSGVASALELVDHSYFVCVMPIDSSVGTGTGNTAMSPCYESINRHKEAVLFSYKLSTSSEV